MTTPEEFQALSDAIEKLRVDALFHGEDKTELICTPEAEQNFLLALSSLDSAQRFVMLAKYATMQKR